MALSFILAASVAAPASAAPQTLDTSFGTNGYAFTALGQDRVPLSIATGVGPAGTIVTAANIQWFGAARLQATEGIRIVQRSPSGQVLDDDLVPFNDSTANVSDVRKLADGRVIATGGSGEGTRAWVAVVNADGSIGTVGEVDSPSKCSFADAVVHQSGQIVVAWRCGGNGSTQIFVYDADDFENQDTAVRGTPAYFGGEVIDLASAPDGSVAVLAELPFENRIVGPSTDARVARININDGGWTRDENFGDEGWTDVRGDERVTVDSANRPVAAEFDNEVTFSFTRVSPAGDIDTSFGDEGTAEVADERLDELEQYLDPSLPIGTDNQNRVLFAADYFFSDEVTTRTTVEGVALVRLNEAGDLDGDFGEGGIWVFGDEGEPIFNVSDPVATSDGAVATFGLGQLRRLRTAVPAPEDELSIGLVKFGSPKTPVTEQPKTEQQQSQQQPTKASSTAASTTAPKKTARTCLSRRSFTIRLRPRNLRSATVLVAGKKVKVVRKNGRLTATVNLRKMQQATFDVAVKGRTAKGKTVTETRSYRTCRVGDTARKVKGGSIIFTVGS
jgi:hypothetical protein